MSGEEASIDGTDVVGDGEVLLHFVADHEGAAAERYASEDAEQRERSWRRLRRRGDRPRMWRAETPSKAMPATVSVMPTPRMPSVTADARAR